MTLQPEGRNTVLHRPFSPFPRSEQDDAKGAKVLRFDPAVRERRKAAQSEEEKRAKKVARTHAHPGGGPSQGGGKKAQSMGGAGATEVWTSGGGRTHGGHGPRRTGNASLPKPYARTRAQAHAEVRPMWMTHMARVLQVLAVLFVVFVLARSCAPGLP